MKNTISLHNVMAITDPYLISSEKLTTSFFEMASAITQSGKLELCKEVEQFFNEIVARARTSNAPCSGMRISSHPSNSEKRKAAGISSML